MFFFNKTYKILLAAVILVLLLFLNPGGGHLNVIWRGGAHFYESPQPVQEKYWHFDTLFRNF